MKTVMLTILDGFGYSDKKENNAVKLANTPNLDRLFKNDPFTLINASGNYVGLPDGQMGNSEVGHMNIGAGRVVYQDLVRINKSIEDGSFYNVKEFNDAIDNAIKNDSKLHILGLVSHGGVHSMLEHLIVLLELCKKRNFDRVFIHAFLDGRDTPPKSALTYLDELQGKIDELEIGCIASVSGRYYSMDRDRRWERVKLSYDMLTKGSGKTASNYREAVNNSYKEEVTDEFVLPCIINKNGLIENNDSVIFFNYRTDRPREITRALVDPDFDYFETKNLNLYYVCMSEYDKTIPNTHIAFKPLVLNNTLGEIVASKGLKQLRIAETEKYAHVTFFFNGGREVEFEGEDRILIPSPKVATYDLKPEMSSYQIKDEVIKAINKGIYSLIVMNFAAPDMVGHTGNLDAAIKAVEAVDECVGEIVSELDKQQGVFILTADHGNCEVMLDESTNTPHTAHTSNLIPFVIHGLDNIKLRDEDNCALEDVAPTILEILELNKPKEMTGISLIK